jgi:hypothetical protein
MEEAPGSRMNLGLPKGYAFDVKFSRVAFLENSTKVNILFSPNESNSNILT